MCCLRGKSTKSLGECSVRGGDGEEVSQVHAQTRRRGSMPAMLKGGTTRMRRSQVSICFLYRGLLYTTLERSGLPVHTYVYLTLPYLTLCYLSLQTSKSHTLPYLTLPVLTLPQVLTIHSYVHRVRVHALPYFFRHPLYFRN